MQPAKSSIQRGQTALWTVTAWAQGGDVPDATIRLMAAPASLKPTFSFGCGSDDGSTSCDLGALDAKSARRQLQAKIAVAASATTVTSVRLTATASAAGLTTDPRASATTSVTAASPAPTNSADPSAPDGTDVAPLTAGNLPYLPSASPVLSPGGNAAGLLENRGKRGVRALEHGFGHLAPDLFFEVGDPLVQAPDLHHPLQHRAPTIGAVHVPRA